MEHDIALLFIGAFFTALIAFVFWLLKRAITKRDKSSIELQYLDNFYAPIYAKIRIGKSITIKEALDYIEEVSSTDPQSIPEYFIEYLNTYKALESYTNFDCQVDADFLNHIETNYIWLSRKLKHDKTKVETDKLCYLDCYNKMNSIARLTDVFLSAFLVTVFLLGLMLLASKQNLFASILLSGFCFGIVVSGIKSFINKWGN